MHQINSAPVIDTSARYRVIVITLCALIALIDGMDTQSIGVVAPSIAQAWRTPPAEFGPVFGGGLLAGTFGAFLFGMVADRRGRKPALIAATLIFAACSVATIWAGSMRELLVARIATGFGLGGALPIIISITSECAPVRTRTRIVALMYCGFPLGAVLGGVATALLVPIYGWQSIFLLGGLLPLLLTPLLVVFVPESVQFLRRQGRDDEAERAVRRLGVSSDGQPAAVQQAAVRASFADLFAPNRIAPTFLIWTTLFLSLLLTVFLVNWIPLIAHAAGLEVGQAVLAVATLNIGGIVGGFTIGRLCDRVRSPRPVAIAYAVGAVAVAALGVWSRSAPGLLATAFVVGMSAVGAQMSAIALSSRLYPSSIRSTGVGYAFGVGRIGAVVGPLLGGLLVGAGPTPTSLFLIAGVVAAAAALSSAAIRPSMLVDG